MAHTFSKIAVAATSGITVISGLRCCHPDCYALFLNFDDSEEHAVKAHFGNVVAATCSIYERLLDSGEVRLYRVLDDDEKSVLAEDDQQMGFVKASTLLKESNKPSSVNQETSPTPAPVVETSPSSQEHASTPSNQALSRQPTELVIMPSLSSFSSISQSSSSSLSCSSFSSGDSGEQKLRRILCAVQGMSDQCRICWVHRETRRPHLTFRCPKGICSGNDWNRYKAGLRFPKNIVCYFCLVPYAAPFDHPQPSPGTRPNPDDCDYPDVLKELVYILYQDETFREKVFSKLGVSQPSTLPLYQRYVGKRQQDGILGAYEVVNAYLELRESGELET